MGAVGVGGERYELALLGNSQKVEVRSWQIEEKGTVNKPFPWKADTWYRLKLQVENMPDGKVRARGKVWPVSESEPAEWVVERLDALGIHHGAAGNFADAPTDDCLANIKVTPNE